EPGIQKHGKASGFRVRAKGASRDDEMGYLRLAAIACIRAAVRSSAGKNVSSASSDSVTSTGVPKIIVVDIKLKISSPNRILNGIATVSDASGADRAGIG